MKQALTMIFAALFVVACGSDDSKEASTTALADKANDATEATATAAETAADSAEELVEDAVSAANDAASQAVDAAEDLADKAGDMADSVTDVVNETVGDAMDVANAAVDDAGAAVAGTVASVDDAPASAKVNVDGNPCTIYMEVGDAIGYSTNSLSVPSSCKEVTVTLEHTGELPKIAMGHNWVLMESDAVQEIGSAAMRLTVEQNYVPEDEERIIASTAVVGPGESSSVTFSPSDMKDGVAYEFACTFPGHWSGMRGTFTVAD